MTPQDFLESVTEDHPRRNFKKNKIESFQNTVKLSNLMHTWNSIRFNSFRFVSLINGGKSNF